MASMPRSGRSTPLRDSHDSEKMEATAGFTVRSTLPFEFELDCLLELSKFKLRGMAVVLINTDEAGKDMRIIVFGFRPKTRQRHAVFDALLECTKPASLWELYAFVSGPSNLVTLIQSVNSYSLCQSYPFALIVPKSITDEEVLLASSFRARCRLPVVTWCHPRTGAVLARSSQPLVGIMMNMRSNTDEKLVAALCSHLAGTSGKGGKLYIADARPRKKML
ncbi:hypothetical protein M0R45_001557 [Rubus argutus]|uniref:Myotubularin phosphatase domain-containing protein n=1 Tax=Rubus argutus TaxID=59490 RepID=A0AAW1VGU5_RUBAR